ncbi:MAG: filamentous hemagglutinin N-terminal domain-containing protein [Rhodoferax sp.]|nr:filamentous hemagglutinin N-terminal domain-containing protein [Rhodoferax sp.]
MHDLSNRFARLRHRARPGLGLCLLAAATPWLGTGAQAQIRTDGSLGPAAQTLTGPNYAIPQTLGKLAGNNLFHSFQTFNLASGQAANFSTTSPTLANVISRVTGGELSQINGTLRLSAAGGATPAFYFINPAGVTFGAGASVDVPGAFHVSTANYLKFPDGRMYADATSGSTFSSADPTAFGFLGATRASITVKDAVLDSKRAGLSLVGGDLAIEHAEVRASTGNIRLVAVGAGPTEVNASGPLPVANGKLELDKQAFVYTKSAFKDPPGGNITVAAGDTTIRAGSLVSTLTSSTQAAGAINAELGSLVIDGRTATASSGITSQSATGNTGRGGDVTVAARGDIQILGGGQITSDTSWSSASGKVAISANTLMLDGAGHKSGARVTNRGSDGDASGLTVEVADSIVLKNSSQISGSNFGAGQAGTVSLRAGKLIRVETDSMVTADTYMDGKAGSINLWAPDITVDGTGGKRLTQISSQALSDGLGNAGAIHITAPGELRVLHGSRIITGTSGKGSGGSIDVTAGALLLDGSNTTRSTGLFSTNEYFSSGNAGSIRIDTPGELRLLNDAKIAANTYGLGRAGDIKVNAGQLLMDSSDDTDLTGIHSMSSALNSGHAGTINVNVTGDAQILRSSRISSNTWSAGNAGSVVFNANNLVLDGVGSLLGAGITSEAGGGSTGNGGAVSVTVPGHLQVLGTGFISSGTSGNGNAGSVVVSSGRLTIDGSASFGVAGIDSATFLGSPGSGGSVDINVAGNATMRNGYIQSTARTLGSAGNISFVVGGNLDVADGGLISSSSDGSGSSGNIEITASGDFTAIGSVFVQSTAYGSGNAGNVNVMRTGYGWHVATLKASRGFRAIRLAPEKPVRSPSGRARVSNWPRVASSRRTPMARARRDRIRERSRHHDRCPWTKDWCGHFQRHTVIRQCWHSQHNGGHVDD